jgi:ubiquinone/menaquinone biosynthesis C-methylase UbiE
MTRGNYKEHWNALSSNIQDARINIIGRADNEYWDATAIQDYEVLDKLLGIGAGDHFLEIGCGVGRLGARVAENCEHWTGVDVSIEMIKHAAVTLFDYPNVSLKEIDGYDLHELPDNSFTKVYCVIVFCHLDEWDRYSYVLEAHRVLKPGGQLLVNNINLCSKVGWAIFENLRALPPAGRDPWISKVSTPQELQEYMKHAGFQDIRVSEAEPWRSRAMVTVIGRK